ncbi:hypothetical protein D3C78_1701970 [compost metagenome]
MADQRVIAVQRAQVAASGMATEDHRCPAAQQLLGDHQVIEQAADLGGDTREVRLRCQGVLHQGDVEARRDRALGDEGEVFLGAVLPIAAMDEDESGRTGYGLCEPVQSVAR